MLRLSQQVAVKLKVTSIYFRVGKNLDLKKVFIFLGFLVS